MKARNACKTCALGMGGQKGGMRNESGHWPEVCKKSLQAMVADMQGAISEDFFKHYSITQLRALTPRELEKSGRLTFPVILDKGASHFRRLSWDDALEKVVKHLRSTQPTRSFFYFSGRSSNEAGFLLQLLARNYGTNHVNNCSYYCHQASGVGLTAALGTGTATVKLTDLESCDLLFLIGANPASNHPRLMTQIMNIRRRGGKVIVFNPVRERGLENFRIPSDIRSLLFGSKMYDEYIQPNIGGDLALLHGIAKVLLSRNAVDRAFIDSHTDGFEQFARAVDKLTWPAIEQASGVKQSTIESLAHVYQQSKATVFAWTMGVTHQIHGTDSVQAIVNLALLRGMVGKPGAGLMPIRGHSNVQGMGTMGVTPKLKQQLSERLSELGVGIPEHEGYDTMACMEAADRQDMDFAWCLGGNLYGSNPDVSFARQAFSKLKGIVYLSTSLNTGHVWGTAEETIILPVLARDEEYQDTTQESMFNYIRFSDGGAQRHVGCKSEVEVVASIGRLLFGDNSPLDWGGLLEHKNIRNLIAKIVPGFESFSKADRRKQEFHIPGRTLHRPEFATPSGKAQFSQVSLATLPPIPSNHLRLMTCRSEGQFNTVVFEEEDLYRGQERRDIILMNADDMRRMKLKKDSLVTVRNETGEMKEIRVRPFLIKEKHAMMYYPEANRLVPRTLDPRSKTPAFKSVLVEVEAEAT